MWEHFPCHYCPTTGIVLFNSNHRWWVAYKGDLTDIKRRWAEYNFELTVSSCTLWLCQSWSWWGRCSLQPFLPATQKIFFCALKQTDDSKPLPDNDTCRWIAAGHFFYFVPLRDEIIMPVNQTHQLCMSVSESDGPLVTPCHSGKQWQESVPAATSRETAVTQCDSSGASVPHSASVTRVQCINAVERLICLFCIFCKTTFLSILSFEILQRIFFFL